MRELLFSVNQQSLKKDCSCDFSNITKGTKGYLKAKFSFDPEWDECEKIVAFFDHRRNEYAFKIKNDECDVPEEALNGKVFYLSVTGVKKNYRITTNKVSVYQR